MGVTAQIEPEMPVILGCVLGLGLCAQNYFIDQRLARKPADALQYPVEELGPQRALCRQLDSDRRQHLSESPQLFQGRLVVDPVEQGRAAILERLRGGDVGENHELLDQAMRVEPFGYDDPIDCAVLREQDLAFGQVKIERTPDVAGLSGAE